MKNEWEDSIESEQNLISIANGRHRSLSKFSYDFGDDMVAAKSIPHVDKIKYDVLETNVEMRREGMSSNDNISSDVDDKNASSACCSSKRHSNGQYNRRKLILQEIELRILYFHCIVEGGN